ncbi:transporter [Marivirga sp.]|uniref:TolB family protein n=1 Tax=Marivirga sp. TaxID=2018662 RepID=UPI0025F30A6C|nr:transporter [Marivirga sp.]
MRLFFLLILITPLIKVNAQIESTIEIFDITTNERTVVVKENYYLEAPNWSKDGKYLVYNSEGNLFKLDLATKEKKIIFTDFADKINNDHGISPDGSLLVISHFDQPNTSDINWETSKIYILPITGGSPKLIPTEGPSFWHGWSPDGETLAFVGARNGDLDIYSIDIKGGKERRLTSADGLDDGPDYSHDGKYIYYNSFQSGKMEIWRMNADGSNHMQLTDDKYSNWFPHPSPEGNGFVYLAYLEDQGSNHPAMKKVALRYYNLEDKSIRTLCEFTGGQGTINVPSWSPSGDKFAFVSY